MVRRGAVIWVEEKALIIFGRGVLGQRSWTDLRVKRVGRKERRYCEAQQRNNYKGRQKSKVMSFPGPEGTVDP